MGARELRVGTYLGACRGAHPSVPSHPKFRHVPKGRGICCCQIDRHATTLGGRGLEATSVLLFAWAQLGPQKVPRKSRDAVLALNSGPRPSCFRLHRPAMTSLFRSSD